jgi:hypothetical protein
MLSIPAHLNSLSMADAFVCYRDAGLRVYPVYPPWADVKDAGKKPALKKWWDSNPYDCNLEKYFPNSRPHNIGACPQPPVYFVDLDSKADKGASVREYLAARPELYKFPRHTSRAGEHLILICEDLPVFLDEHGNRYLSPLRAQLTEAVSAEFFHSPHSNLVLPCSRHPLRDNPSDPYFTYSWTHTGEIPRVTWQWLRDTFGLKAPEYPLKSAQRKKAPGTFNSGATFPA